ncbi:hypothetical protein AX14_008960 [Amanita brunnescens Koide BX004]|nr:hypothetical protein AX14_008960 [Amanita brunnescens Koide BX004]
MLVQPLFILLLAVSAISAASKLKVSLTGPEYIDHVRDLRVFSTITNNGEDTLNILHDPRGVLSDLPADKFLITNERNLQPKFIGIRAKYVPAIAAESGEYTTLKPGQSVTIEHDLSAAYDFSSLGAGEYTICPSGCLYIADGSGDIVPFSADTEHHIAKIAGTLARSTADQPTIEKRAKFIGCSSSQESEITSAILTATQYAKKAFNYLQAHLSGTPRYATWFGDFTDERRDAVISHFAHIHGNDFSSFTYDCTCSDPGVFAYVKPEEFGDIHLCDAFWQAPTSGTDSKAGTLIHAASFFTLNGGTLDEAYGQEAAEELAHDSPSEAVNNADSHEYFAENDPALN